MSQASADPTRIYPQLAALPHRARYQFLASSHRRLTLDILDERRTPMSLSELAVAIVERDDDLTDDDDDVNRVEMMLYHQHLPKMDDLGVIDYDRSAKCIAPPG